MSTRDVATVDLNERALAPELPRDVLDIADDFHNQIEIYRGAPALPRLPTIDENKRLRALRTSVFLALTPVSGSGPWMERATTAVALLLGAYPNMKGEALDNTAVYLENLRDLPLWTILSAIKSVRDGDEAARRHKVKPEYPPSAIQLRQIANELCEPYGETLGKLDRVLKVNQLLPRLTSAEKKRQFAKVSDGFDKLLQRMNAPLRRAREKRLTEINEALAKDAEEAVLRDYERLGLDPYRNKKGMVISLPMLIKRGARVEREAGRNVLTLPEGFDGK